MNHMGRHSVRSAAQFVQLFRPRLVVGVLLLPFTVVAFCPASSAGERIEREPVVHSDRVTVHPVEIGDLLYNRGMGLADFHFGFKHPPTLEEHPPATVAYFRWLWAELEPEEGAYNFALVDRVIAQAKAKGETLAFQIMTEYEKGSPRWLYAKGIASVQVGGDSPAVQLAIAGGRPDRWYPLSDILVAP